jgi:Zn-dependent protease
MDPILANIFSIIVLVISVVIHEVAHGAVANSLGDPTAKFAGRLTLNPFKHLDWFGSLALPLFLVLTTGIGFGYAKPVPINPFNFRDQKYGMVKVALAGIGANLALALVFGLLLRLSLSLTVPVNPNLNDLLAIIVGMNLWLAIFNLMPIPPLDGSHVLFAFLPRSQEDFKVFLQRYGFIFFLIFIFYFSSIISPIVNFLARLIIGGPL